MDYAMETALLELSEEEAEWAIALRPEEFWMWFDRTQAER